MLFYNRCTGAYIDNYPYKYDTSDFVAIRESEDDNYRRVFTCLGERFVFTYDDETHLNSDMYTKKKSEWMHENGLDGCYSYMKNIIWYVPKKDYDLIKDRAKHFDTFPDVSKIVININGLKNKLIETDELVW